MTLKSTESPFTKAISCDDARIIRQKASEAIISKHKAEAQEIYDNLTSTINKHRTKLDNDKKNIKIYTIPDEYSIHNKNACKKAYNKCQTIRNYILKLNPEFDIWVEQYPGSIYLVDPDYVEAVNTKKCCTIM